MTGTGQRLSSSSSSISLSESLYSGGDLDKQNVALLLMEDENNHDCISDDGQDMDEEQACISDDGQDMDEEQALVVPLPQSFEAEPVAILIQQDEVYSEYKEEAQQQLGKSSQQDEKIRQDSIMQASIKGGNYLPAPFLPANFLVCNVSNSNKLDKVDEYFKDCLPEATNKKRSRDETTNRGKQKEQFHHHHQLPSSDEHISYIDANFTEINSPIRSQVVGRFEACSFQDDNVEHFVYQDPPKQRLFLNKPKSKRDGKSQGRASYNTTDLVQWQKMVNLPVNQDPKRRSYWPNWLHPAFHQESDDIIPRISGVDLDRLFRAIPDCQCTTLAYSALFQSVFGPLVFWNREDEMMETIRAVGILLRRPVLMSVYYEIDRCEPILEGLALNNLFAFRYLSSFTSFAAFLNRDEEYKYMLSEEQYQRLTDQLLNWYGGSGEVEDYQLWASARMLELDRDLERPMSPKDLNSTDLRNWQERLDLCSTYEDAETVTEEVFGPLQQVDHYIKPRVNIKAVWNPCECSICLRSHKRARIDG